EGASESREQENGSGDEERGSLAVLQADGLRDQLAEDDTQEGDEEEGDDGGERTEGGVVNRFKEPIEYGLEQGGHRRFGEPAEEQAGQDSAKLGGGDAAVEIARGRGDRGGSGHVLLLHLLDAGLTQRDQRKLRRHK